MLYGVFTVHCRSLIEVILDFSPTIYLITPLPLPTHLAFFSHFCDNHNNVY